MLESIPVTLGVGTVLGFLGGLGIGGGSLLVLWLTTVLHVEQALARSINLLFFLPCALISCLFRWKQGSICIQKLLPAILCGCISAGFFSWLSITLETALLKKLFGGLLLLTGLRELCWKTQ